VNAALLAAGLDAQQDADEAVHARVQLEALLAGVAEGVMVFDASGRILLMNAPAARITDLSGAHREGTDAQEILWQRLDGSPVLHDDWPRFRALRGERFTDEELVGVSRDGSEELHVLFSGSSVADSGGIVLAIVTSHDVTEMRRLEKLRDEYVGLISHDLRGPLSVVLLGAQRLARRAAQASDAEMSEIVGLIETSATRMQTMIEELLEGDAVESSGFAVEKEPIAAVALVRSLVTQVATVNKNRRIELICPDQIQPIAGDKSRLERVLMNLISNALKYSDDGSPIEIGIKPAAGELTVSIRDYGQGIASDELSLVFERSYRTKNAVSGSGQSYGLGLYIARRIIEAHGGRIWAESEIGVGTTFSFSLPMEQERA
jgi:PAS domain S-box-containing protein